MSKYRTLKYPPTVFWEVTEKCNHNCVHCFNYWRTDLDKIHSVVKTEEEYLKVAKKIVENKPVKVVFTGGEPLTVFHKIRPAIDYIKEQSISVSFNTNIALLTEEMAAYFREKNVSLFVSFPSVDETIFNTVVDTAQAFKKVVSALDLAHKYKLDVYYNAVISKLNLKTIFDTAQFLKQRYNARQISITRVSMPINAQAHFDEYMLTKAELDFYLESCVRINKELGMRVQAASPITPCSVSTNDAYNLFAFEGSCEAGKSSYVIGSNGMVRACARDDKEYGLFMAEPFHDLWQSMEEWRDDSFTPSECSKCEHLSRCHGGCRVDSIIKGGNRCGLDNYSDPTNIHKEFVKQEAYMPRWDYATEFTVPANLCFVEEDFAVRVSHHGLYAYCTPKFADYLRTMLGVNFTLHDFCKSFELDFNDAVSVLNYSVSNGIIKIKA